MVSEDSGCIHSVHSSIPTASVHGERSSNEDIELLRVEMLALRHRLGDLGEDDEVSLLRAQEGLCVEEWDDLRQQVVPLAYDEHQRGVGARAMVLGDATAAQTPLDEVEDLTPFCVLADVELGNELPPESRPVVAANRNVKRTFSVNKTRDVCVQPFLLIVRTAWIVTVHECTLEKGWDTHERVPADTRSFQQIAEFIDSAENPLSRDVLNPARVPL